MPVHFARSRWSILLGAEAGAAKNGSYSEGYIKLNKISKLEIKIGLLAQGIVHIDFR